MTIWGGEQSSAMENSCRKLHPTVHTVGYTLAPQTSIVCLSKGRNGAGLECGGREMEESGRREG